VALGASGAMLARGSAAYPTRRPAAGAHEQDPADWLRAAERAVAQAGGVVPARRWRAIGLAGMIPALVTLDPEGRPTGPAVTWQDARADDLGDEFRERCGAARLYRLTGQWVDGRYLLPMFGRIARDDPPRAAATATVASAKDYLFAWLTGELATDPSTASGDGCYELEDGRWNDAALAMAGWPGRAGGGPGLPAVRPCLTSRPLRARAAARPSAATWPTPRGVAHLGTAVHPPSSTWGAHCRATRNRDLQEERSGGVVCASGAMTTSAEIEYSSSIARTAPLLRKSARGSRR
jgi:xylulokinase